MSIGDVILVCLAVAASIPIGVIAVETAMAFFPVANRSRIVDARPACAILIPAHNEEAGIARTIDSLRKEMSPNDRVVVIADNCSDATAANAIHAGSEAIERHDPDRRGKGYALAYGLKHLEVKPPAVVVFIDADTRTLAGSLDALVREAAATQRPIQGVFTDSPQARRGAREQWSAFALQFKNYVRPLGLHHLTCPCLLTGSGMAFPWTVVQGIELGTGNIVEDMQLGIDLALAGHPPRFCPEARFESDDAPNIEATAKRRTRWEHGHVFTMMSQIPRLLGSGIVKCRPRLLVLALELCVPPLSLLLILNAGLLGICMGWWQLGGSIAPALILIFGLVVGIATILAAWSKFGRKLLSLKILCLLPIYVLWKVPIYLKLMVAPQKTWVRTERNPTA